MKVQMDFTKRECYSTLLPEDQLGYNVEHMFLDGDIQVVQMDEQYGGIHPSFKTYEEAEAYIEEEIAYAKQFAE